MKALNGRFDFASAPKQGTTATFTLPIGQCTTSILFHETQPAGDLHTTMDSPSIFPSSNLSIFDQTAT
jgi:hypothetical protein